MILAKGLAWLPPTTNKELRVWHVTASMLETGDLLVPRIHGVPHLTKPPLLFWLSALGCLPFGGPDLLGFRLVSVFSALGILGVTMAMGKQVSGEVHGLLGGVILLGMSEFVVQGRMAVFESLFVLLSLGLLWTLYRMLEEQDPAWMPRVCLLFVLCFFTRATTTFMVILPPVALHLVLSRRGGVLRSPRVWLWIPATLVLSISWYLVLVWRVPEAWEVFVGQFLLPFDVETETATKFHGEPFYFYIPALAEITLPAALLLPLMIRRGWRTHLWREDSFLRFLSLIVVGVVGAFTLLPQKQEHYIYVVTVPLAVLTAEAILADLSSGDRFGRIYLQGVGIVFGVCLLGAAVPVGFFGWEVFSWPRILTVGTCILFVGIASGILYTSVRREWPRLCLLVVSGLTVLYLFALGTFEVWDRQFVASTMTLRSDYDPDQWRETFIKHPWVRRIFNEKEKYRFDPGPVSPQNPGTARS